MNDYSKFDEPVTQNHPPVVKQPKLFEEISADGTQWYGRRPDAKEYAAFRKVRDVFERLDVIPRTVMSDEQSEEWFEAWLNLHENFNRPWFQFRRGSLAEQEAFLKIANDKLLAAWKKPLPVK